MAYSEFAEPHGDKDRTRVWYAFSLLCFYLLLFLMGAQATKMLLR